MVLELAEPIRELSKEKVPFSWGPEPQSAFTMMKKVIAKAPVLPYYNWKKQTVVQTDISIKGPGACLLQDERPVYFASKALTEAQKGYVAIDLGSLAVTWTMKQTRNLWKQCCQQVLIMQPSDCKDF